MSYVVQKSLYGDLRFKVKHEHMTELLKHLLSNFYFSKIVYKHRLVCLRSKTILGFPDLLLATFNWFITCGFSTISEVTFYPIGTGFSTFRCLDYRIKTCCFLNVPIQEYI